MKEKIGLIGLGPMGMRHFKSCKNLGFKNIFLCDLKLNRVIKLQKKNFYQEWKSLIKNQNLDILIVSSTADSHYEIVKFAIQNGVKKIICEKPITNCLSQAKDLINLSKKKKTIVTVNYIRRWSSSYSKLKRLLESRRMGGIKNIYFEMGGGQLASNGGHLFDLCLYLTGSKPKSIFSKIDISNTPHPRGKKFKDPGAFGILRLNNNIRVFFDMMEDYGTPILIKILCKYGNVIIDEKNKEWRIYARKIKDQKIPLTKRPILEKIKFKGHGMIDFVKSSEKTIQDILKAKKINDPACNIQDGYNSLELAIAAYYSFKKNKEVRLPLTNNNIIKKKFKFT